MEKRYNLVLNGQHVGVAQLNSFSVTPLELKVSWTIVEIELGLHISKGCRV